MWQVLVEVMAPPCKSLLPCSDVFLFDSILSTCRDRLVASRLLVTSKLSGKLRVDQGIRKQESDIERWLCY